MEDTTVAAKLERKRKMPESRRFRLCRSKTEYMERTLSNKRETIEDVLTLDVKDFPVSECIKYLG